MGFGRTLGTQIVKAEDILRVCWERTGTLRRNGERGEGLLDKGELGEQFESVSVIDKHQHAVLFLVLDYR